MKMAWENHIGNDVAKIQEMCTNACQPIRNKHLSDVKLIFCLFSAMCFAVASSLSLFCVSSSVAVVHHLMCYLCHSFDTISASNNTKRKCVCVCRVKNARKSQCFYLLIRIAHFAIKQHRQQTSLDLECHPRGWMRKLKREEKKWQRRRRETKRKLYRISFLARVLRRFSSGKFYT